jgi:Glycosyl hydrolases family 43/Peptidase of plants and bacteria
MKTTMLNYLTKMFAVAVLLLAAGAKGGGRAPGNPVFPGWYADPEGTVFGDRYWIYPTFSAPYDEQLFFDAFSSPDLVNWTKHERILDHRSVTWLRRALWAPSIIGKDGKYFLFFSANDIQNNEQEGGIGVAVADRPEGPFRDHLGKPLIDRFHHGAQPIDPFVFRDVDGKHYLFYGGWRHCNVARLRDDFRGFEPFPDGGTFKEVTPEHYVEGPFMFVRNGKYYFMWSEGGWTGPDYSVAYAIADGPTGPFKRIGKILQQDPAVATGAGHHSVIQVPGKDTWHIVYHRRPLGERDGNHRVTCIDRMEFDENGLIRPVRITVEGPGAGISAKGEAPEKIKTMFEGEGIRIMLDSTASPDLLPWFQDKAIPAMLEWYPRIVKMIAIPGETPPTPTAFHIELREGQIMPGRDGIPGFASGNRIVVSSKFMRDQMQGESLGCLIHEMVHIVQFGSGQHAHHSAPSWFLEGATDYIRWFHFEPEKNGAVIGSPDHARYNDSYRVTANFMDWVIRNHSKDLLAKAHIAIHKGYSDDLWEKWTGKPLAELEAEWKADLKTLRPPSP